MLRINYAEDRRLIGKAAGVNPLPIDPVIARAEDDILMGGFMFTNFTGNGGSIWVTAVGLQPNWLSKKLLISSFGYVFNQLKCRALFARIAVDNQKSLDFICKLGFNQIYFLDHVYPDGRGQYIFRMLPDECRWLTGRPIGASVH